MKTIDNELIRSLTPCYDPSEKGIPDGESLTVRDWVAKYREVVPGKDIIWLLASGGFIPDKDLRLFAVECARESIRRVEEPYLTSIEACRVAERYAHGEATYNELQQAGAAARQIFYSLIPTCDIARLRSAQAAHRATEPFAKCAAYFTAYAVALSVKPSLRSDVVDAQVARLLELIV